MIKGIFRGAIKELSFKFNFPYVIKVADFVLPRIFRGCHVPLGEKMLQVLMGKLKGLKLKVPRGGTRPTTVLLRRKLFDQFIDWREVSFVDLCAGTGAMGLEALSRGCFEVFFFEKNERTFLLLKGNLELAKKRKTENLGKITCGKGDFLRNLELFFLNSPHMEKKYFYFDPPYEKREAYERLGAFLQEKKNRFSQSTWWIETDEKKGLTVSEIEGIIPLEMVKVFSQKDKKIACFRGYK